MSLHEAIALPAASDAAGRLRAALALVECMAGEPPSDAAGQARTATALARAAPVARRRHDALAGEATAFAAAGLAALLRCRDATGADPAAAAGRLADELRGALDAMARAAGLGAAR